jgi:hypothetical protein
MMVMAHFCTHDDALVLQNILSFFMYKAQFVKPPSDTLLRYDSIYTLADDAWPANNDSGVLLFFYIYPSESSIFIINVSTRAYA